MIQTLQLIRLIIASFSFALFFLVSHTFASDTLSGYSAITATNLPDNATKIELQKWRENHWSPVEGEIISGYVVPRRILQMRERTLLVLGVYDDKVKKIKNFICFIGECKNRRVEIKLSSDEIGAAKLIYRNSDALIIYESADIGTKYLRYKVNSGHLEEIEGSVFQKLIKGIDGVDTNYSVRALPISNLSCDSVSQIIDEGLGRNYAIVFEGQSMIRFTPFSDSLGCKNQS